MFRADHGSIANWDSDRTREELGEFESERLQIAYFEGTRKQQVRLGRGYFLSASRVFWKLFGGGIVEVDDGRGSKHLLGECVHCIILPDSRITRSMNELDRKDLRNSLEEAEKTKLSVGGRRRPVGPKATGKRMHAREDQKASKTTMLKGYPLEEKRR